MATYRVQIGFQCDSALPADVETINPCFVGDNPQALGDALKNNLIATPGLAADVPFTVKVYDALKPPPNYPLYQVKNGSGFKATNYPRELAMCLSYYAAFNRPRFRGRLFIPFWIITGPTGLRPTNGQQLAAAAFADTFGKNLPANHHWAVFSKKTGGAGAIVTDWWVDNEWDIQRSRGLKGTSRITGTVGP
jgi:hypothetical protein